MAGLGLGVGLGIGCSSKPVPVTKHPSPSSSSSSSSSSKTTTAPGISVPPLLDHDDFSKSDKLAVTRPVTGLFQVELVRIVDQIYEIHPAPMREYRAIPLAAYLATRGTEIGQGDHLIVTNIRGEQLYLTRADIAKHEPVIVIGIDDERNLFRIFTSYRLKREYTWRTTEPPPTMIRPVGPFLFFPNGEPPEIEDTTLAKTCLTPSSFRFVKDDPLSSIRSLPSDVREALTGRDGCLKCHTFRGAGAHAHHVRAIDGKPHGGNALALEEYPREVLQRFLFDQETVAASFGVDPLHIPEPAAKELFGLITR